MGTGEGGDRWVRRPAAAFALRAAILLVPVVLAVAAGVTASMVLPQPHGVQAIVAWLVVVLGVTTIVLVVTERLARRFAPLALLLRLGMVFPDAAPPRYRVAIRAVRPERLAHQLDPADEASPEHALSLLAALLVHDRLTRGHSERVAALTAMLVDQLGLDEAERLRIEWGALLHDVGKLEVPGEILRKPAKLDAAEWAVMREHPAAGRHLVEPLRGWLGDALASVDGHHEFWDGTGYPDGRSGREIPIAARVVAVTDAYETMTAARSYKTPLSRNEARAELTACAGGQFDPGVVRAFLGISLPRLWLVAGPAAWLVQVPIIGAALRGTVFSPGLPAPVAGVAASAGQAAAVAFAGGAVVVGTSLATPADPPAPAAATELGADAEVAPSSDPAGPTGGAEHRRLAPAGDAEVAAAAAAVEVAAVEAFVEATGGGGGGEGGGDDGSGDGAPGQSGSAPGQTGSTPGQSGTAPGQSGNTPGHGGSPPGQSGTAPGQSGNTPGQSGNAPGHGGTPPGHGGTPPGQQGR